MAHYLVTARPDPDKLVELRNRLDSGEIEKMRPFGTALHYSLLNARDQGGGLAIWEEEDYCAPPLAMERAAVLDAYFTELSVEKVKRDSGWKRIDGLSSLWKVK